MPRGFVWAVYIDNGDQVWRLRVNADYVDEDQRGWVAADPNVTNPLPRGWLPRIAVGVGLDGSRRHARVATRSAALWLGAATTFSVEGSDGLFHPYEVVELVDEVTS